MTFKRLIAVLLAALVSLPALAASAQNIGDVTITSPAGTVSKCQDFAAGASAEANLNAAGYDQHFSITYGDRTTTYLCLPPGHGVGDTLQTDNWTFQLGAAEWAWWHDPQTGDCAAKRHCWLSLVLIATNVGTTARPLNVGDFSLSDWHLSVPMVNSGAATSTTGRVGLRFGFAVPPVLRQPAPFVRLNFKSAHLTRGTGRGVVHDVVHGRKSSKGSLSWLWRAET